MSIIKVFAVCLLFFPQLSFLLFAPSDNQLTWTIFIFVFFPCFLRLRLNNKAAITLRVLIIIFALSIIVFSIQYFLLTGASEVLLLDGFKQVVSYGLVPIAFLCGCVLSSGRISPRTLFKGLWLCIAIAWLANIARLFLPPELVTIFVSRTLDNNFAIANRGLASAFSEPSFVPSWSLIMSTFYPFLLFYRRTLRCDNAGQSSAIGLFKFLVNNPWFFLLNLIFLSFASRSGQILVVIVILLSSFFIAYVRIICFSVASGMLDKHFIMYVFFFVISVFISIATAFSSSSSQSASRFHRIAIALFDAFKANSVQTILSYDISLTARLHALLFPFVVPFAQPFNVSLSKNMLMIGYPHLTSDLYQDLLHGWRVLFGSVPFIFPRRLYSIVGNISYDFSFVGSLGVFIIVLIFFASTYSYVLSCMAPEGLSGLRKDSKVAFVVNVFSLLSVFLCFINLSLLFAPFWVLLGFIVNWQLASVCARKDDSPASF